MEIFDRIHLDLTAQEKELLALARTHTRGVGRERLTVREMCEGYLSLSDLKEVTRTANAYHLRPVVGLFGDRLARCVGAPDMEAFRQIQRGRGIMASTIARRLTVYKAAVHWAVRTRRLSASPLADLRIPSVRSRRQAPPTIAELNAMLRTGAPHVQRAIVLGLYTGARPGPSELFALQWPYFNFNDRTIWVPNADKGETDAGRIVPMRDDIVPLLLHWREQDAGCPWVIHYHRRPVKSMGTAWRTAQIRADIRRFARYPLRHAHATFDVRGGFNARIIADILGHAGVDQVLGTYYHVADVEKWEVIQSLPALDVTALLPS